MDRNSTIVSFFETQVRESPDAVAVLAADQTLTYDQLNARANQVAWHLSGVGVKTETLVGVCLKRSVDLVVALLGILKVGGVYVPLDPEHPSERLALLVQDSKASVLVTTERLLSRLSSVGTQIICLDQCQQILSTFPRDNFPAKVLPDNLAFVLYTSGSTGIPKGVLMKHRGFCNLAAIHQQAFGLDNGSRVLLFGAPSHGNAVIEVVVALSTGATLCVEPYESILPSPALFRLLGEQAITHLHIPPTALAALPVGGPAVVVCADGRRRAASGEACESLGERTALFQYLRDH